MQLPDRLRSPALRSVTGLAAGLACALVLVGCGGGNKGVKPPKGELAVAPTYVARDSDQVRQQFQYQNQIALAGTDLRAGNLDAAEKRARAAQKLIPNGVDALLLLAGVAERRGNTVQAGELLQRAAALAPERGDILNNYAAWLCQQGRSAESLGWFERALAAPGYATPELALSNAGACALQAGQPERAERDLRAALERDPRNAQSLTAMAELSFADGRFMEARAFSERRLAAAPPTRSVLQLASQIEARLGDQRAADRYQQRIRQEFPQDADLNSKG